jgi:hypothetical protein
MNAYINYFSPTGDKLRNTTATTTTTKFSTTGSETTLSNSQRSNLRPSLNSSQKANTSFNTLDHIFNILIDLFSNQTYGETPIATSSGSKPNGQVLSSFDLETTDSSSNEMDSFWLQTSSVYPVTFRPCAMAQLETCCQSANISASLFICYNCGDLECPCNCNATASLSLNPGGGKTGNGNNRELGGAGFPGFDFSVSSYTFALSVGLPCVSIFMIICTLVSITYCCRSSGLGRRGSDEIMTSSEVMHNSESTNTLNRFFFFFFF